VKQGDGTGDRNILRRRWLPIDCDPERPTGISATAAEREHALERARQIARFLREKGWQLPLVGDSGNGAHLLYRVDLPADDGGLVKSCLEALALRFGGDGVKVDTSNSNPARIWKLYGTVARKGDSTPDRPHRLASLTYELRWFPSWTGQGTGPESRGRMRWNQRSSDGQQSGRWSCCLN